MKKIALAILLVFVGLGALAAEMEAKLVLGKSYLLILDRSASTIINQNPAVLTVRPVYGIDFSKNQIIFTPRAYGDARVSIKCDTKIYDFSLSVGEKEDIDDSGLVEIDIPQGGKP